MFKTLLFTLLVFISSNAFANKTLSIGSTLSPISMNNQHDKVITVSKDVKTILFAIEKAPSAVINDYLKSKDAGFLVKNKAYFIADISGMPSLITSMFAIPKMKKRPYDILLARGKALAQVTAIPRKKEFVTVLKVAGGKVVAIHYVNNLAQLEKLF